MTTHQHGTPHPPAAQAHASAHAEGVGRMAVSATLHCLTGCAVGEIVGLVVGTAAGLGTGSTVVLSIALAFVFGFGLSSLPLVRAGLGLGSALRLVLAADTVSIATMEVTDNAVMAVIPGAMDAGLVNVVFWVGMAVSLGVAFRAAWPVNVALLRRGRGHALTHGVHADGAPTGARRFVPELGTGALLTALVAFMLGGLVVAVADTLAGRG